jgi:hypothetical protein
VEVANVRGVDSFRDLHSAQTSDYSDTCQRGAEFSAIDHAVQLFFFGATVYAVWLASYHRYEN